jgi:hypothetical protein
MRDLAARLIAIETRAKNAAESNSPAPFSVCERLRPHLATLMGKDGFRALLSRALAVARAEMPWLEAVQVKADGSLGPELQSAFWSYTVWPVIAGERVVGVVIQVGETAQFQEKMLAMNEALTLGSNRVELDYAQR